jgi:endonuclease/exonuclease/phosphatase (EEP) superfamily protein YafD
MTRPAFALPLALAVAAGVAALAILLGFLNALHPAFDSLSHFRLHLAAGLVAAGLLLLATRFRRGGLAGIAIASICFAATPGTWLDTVGGTRANASASPPDRAVYRLLHFNARYDNPAPERFLSLIARIRPDIVTVNEVSQLWRARLETLSAAYPHRIVCDARGKVGGVAILSRRPFSPGASAECADGGTLAVADVDFAGQTVAIGALHLYWPWPFEQSQQVARLTPRLRALPDAAILAGDFNAVRWSETVRTIADAGRLGVADPVGPTWLPGGAPDALRRAAGLGIDHVLAGSGVVVTAIGRAEDAASDHLPVVVEFWLPAPAKPGQSETIVDGRGGPGLAIGSAGA